MICNYAPRVAVHGDRYGSARPLPPKWVVIHTSEGGEGGRSADALAGFLTAPGDRITSTGRYGSSYHAIADVAMRIIPAVHDGFVAFSAPGANTEGLHVCIPGRAGQTREQWLDDASRSMIRTVAGYVLDMRTLYGIPPLRLTVAELRAGTRGYTDHAGIRDAFGRTTHYDVGPNFPWDVLAADVRELSRTTPIKPPNPQPKDDTVLVNYVKHPNHEAVYCQWSNGTKTWVRDLDEMAVLLFVDPRPVETMPNDAWMRATGVIVGPLPAGVDGWGVPSLGYSLARRS